MQNFIGILDGLKDFSLFTMGCPYMITRNVNHQVHLDACLHGLGRVWQNYAYHLPITCGYKDLNIAHLDMVNILVALKVFCHQWATKHILLHCDNQAVVCVLQSGKAKDPFLGPVPVMCGCGQPLLILN